MGRNVDKECTAPSLYTEADMLPILLLIFKKSETIANQRNDAVAGNCWSNSKHYIMQALAGDRAGLLEALEELKTHCWDDDCTRSK